MAVRGSDSLLRRPQIRPGLQCLCLKVFHVALDRLIVEAAGHVVVRAYRFIAQQLPQIGESLDPGEPRCGDIGLELKQLKLDLEQIVFADVTRLVSRLADVHRVLEALEILVRQLQSRFGEFDVDELGGNGEGEAALIVGDLRPRYGGLIFGCLQAMLTLFAALKEIADTEVELRTCCRCSRC